MSQSGVPEPRLLLNGTTFRSADFDLGTLADSLPTIIENDNTKLADLLRNHRTEDVHNKSFWSLGILQHIFTRNRVLKELKKPEYSELNSDIYIEHICPDEENIVDKDTPTYLRIFALLILQAKGPGIVQFEREKVSDQRLPLVERPGGCKARVELVSKDCPEQALSCFDNWCPHERETFQQNQWKLLVPFFEPTHHYQLDDNTILPWCDKGDYSLSPEQLSENEGGFATVNRVKIDPLSHGFREVLKAISLKGGLFAVKTLRESVLKSEERFRNESKQLRRFNGLVHDHLVTLLATYTQSGHYNFIFPYATYALDQYWAFKATPPRDIETVRWVAKQCFGIMEAMDTIHYPKHLNNLQPEPGFGRHGDIKPDNILWFDSTKDPEGILVLSDFGLAAFHRETSRSNIPNDKIPKVPGYRPPECDIIGGTISRAYDIWTLGCLFLEILTWLLGGNSSREDFSQKRTTLFLITQSNNDIFFSLKRAKGSDTYIAQVKEEVTRWFQKLHSEENCCEFLHDSLDVIEKEMLVVMSGKKRRSLSTTLRGHFQNFHNKCQDISNPEYCTKGVPRKWEIKRAETGVDVFLNETAKKEMETKSELIIEEYEGKRYTSMTEEGLKNIDEGGI